MTGPRASRMRPFLQRLPIARDRPLIGYAFAIAMSVAAMVLRARIGQALPPGFPYLTFFPAVIVVAFLFGLRPGILAAILCGFAAWFLFIPPFASFVLTYDSALAVAFYVFIVTVEIAFVHLMQIANAAANVERERSEALADNREMLFRELQHRVGNNLQMVAALISMQKRRMPEGDARTALDEASRRLALVGRIQRQLYRPDGAQLALGPYIEQIARGTIEASGRDDIVFEMGRSTAAELAPDRAIPTALIVAEAISNAIEHAFADRSGTIRAAVEDHGGGFAITIDDDGDGLPDGFDGGDGQSLGLRIAHSLGRSVGEFKLEPRPDRPGARARLVIAPA